MTMRAQQAAAQPRAARIFHGWLVVAAAFVITLLGFGSA